MQKIEHLRLTGTLSTNDLKKDIETIEEKVSQLSSEGWAIDGIVPLSYAKRFAGSVLSLTDIALLISK